ncbi:MAG: hypothetical protein SLAVMIC_00908 [uncultured marine phage]|uniref:Uncharacterized protein n=1 Tax=uncultured marine phage TaxID=707152 RepID=A0A8D9C9Q8_9VIRU|nr:MAG: hypothetical protein SLAVMIC_00908 [uncultured marine phage]
MAGKGLIHGKQIRSNSIGVDKLDFDLGGSAIQYNGDYHLSVTSSIIGNSQSTGLSPSESPIDDTAFYVHVNGIVIEVGDGVTNKSVYFSEDNGVNAIMINEIGTQSVMYWNASIANYILSPTDRVTFEYEISGTASLTLVDFGGQPPSYYLNRQNHTNTQTSTTISDFNYVHNQSFTASTWNIAHNLGRYPNINIVDNSNLEIEGSIEYVDLNNIEITFNSGVSGMGFLS